VASFVSSSPANAIPDLKKSGRHEGAWFRIRDRGSGAASGDGNWGQDVPKRSDYEQAEIARFLQVGFSEAFEPTRLSPSELEVVKEVEQEVQDAFSSMKYLLGLTVDFAIVAEQLAGKDEQAKAFQPQLTKEELFARYTLVEMRGKRKSNTLTLVFGGQGFGIRKIEERFVDLLHDLNRTSYPSAYVYNTGQWRKFEDLLVKCFRLSSSGRWRLCNDLLDYCLERLPEDRLLGRPTPRVSLFPRIIQVYERSAEAENAGLTLQAITYGWVKADRPHLSLSVEKVRGGSSRQRRFGDVDAYYGIDLEVSVEVKDRRISMENVQRELGTFAKKVKYNRVPGLAVVADADANVREHLSESGISVLTLQQLSEDVRNWDWPKQDHAVHGMLHYLAHVEQNVFAVRRLLAFIKKLDERHDSLVYADAGVGGETEKTKGKRPGKKK
jgi:hypothetical protein